MTAAVESSAFEPHWVQAGGTTVRRVLRPSSFAQAMDLLAEDPTRRVVSGGTDLVVDLARGQAEPVELVDLTGIAGARDIRQYRIDGDDPHPTAMHGRTYVVLGFGVTHNQVVSDPKLVERCLPLAQACLEIGSPQLRNRATIAGNVATASPANDSISALMALGAWLEVTSAATEPRWVRIQDFFTGVRQTVLAPGELISDIWVPELGPNARGIWVKLGLRKAQAISVVHAAVVVEFAADDPRSTIVDARIALGSVAPTVVLADAAHVLVGRALDADTLDEVARAASAEVAPIDDGRATADYRSAGVETVVRRALAAIERGAERSTWPKRIPTLGQSTPTLVRADHATSIDDTTEVAVSVNGTEVTAAGAASVTLLDWLRDHAGTGTKEGCAEGECGACTVMLDGAATMACLTPAAQADRSAVTTVEGLAGDQALSAMQQSFVDNFAVQCGYCIPGFVVSATALVDELDAATREEIELGLSGNLCRCTGYYAILEAVRAVGDTA